MTAIDFNRFRDLTYDSFRQMARDASLSSHEKIGFPDSYREGKGAAIFADICSKLPRLNEQGCTVLDIGPGCDELAHLMIEHCAAHHHRLILIDAPEMLDLLPDAAHIIKMPGRYPFECAQLFEDYAGQVDAVLAYSVAQILYAEGLYMPFIDLTLTLLTPGGQWLIGDIPNISKRKRFFASDAGAAFHQQFMQTDEHPVVQFNTLDIGQMDDSVIFSTLLRCRLAGFDAYVLPQPATLPMANRREDIVIVRP
jgi:hypothetical protein